MGDVVRVHKDVQKGVVICILLQHQHNAEVG